MKKEILEFKLNQIVVISKNAPENYSHYIKQDSLGKIIADTLGIKMNFANNGFTYFNSQNIVKT